MAGLVSILLLAHNKAAHTERCLESLLASSYRPVEILAVDNGSVDRTGEVLAAFVERARTADLAFETVRLPENVGAVRGRNASLERLRGEWIVFLDNDVAVRTRSWLERFTRYFEGNARSGAVGPKLVYPNPPHAIQCAGCDVTKGGRVIFRGRGEPRETPVYGEPREVQALISACWMMPAARVRELGPLDERFSPAQFEDIDYCYRLRAAGYACVVLPKVEMYHFENVTTDGTPALNYRYVTVKNGLKFKEKWGHVTATEPGPEDAAWSWREIPAVRPDEIGALETVP